MLADITPWMWQLDRVPQGMSRSFSLPRGAFALLLAAGCVRSTPDLPAPGEGVFVSGLVVEREASSGEVVPVRGARVQAIGVSISATTDQRGFFQLERLPLGRIKIHIERRADGARPALSRSLDPLKALVEGQLIDLGEIELLPTGGLAGFVGKKLEDRPIPAPASGALVIGAQTAFKAISGEDGNYLLFGLPEGSIDLVAFLQDHAPGRIAGVRVASGARTIVEDLVLKPAPANTMIDIFGRATLRDEADSSGIAVEFLDEREPSTVAGSANTDAGGAFSLTLGFGVYRARFMKTGYVPAEIPGVAVLEEGVVGLVPVLLGKSGDGDLDGDGIPDSVDPDMDNDGCPNEQDQFPTDSFSCTDTDHDGIPDELDADDDEDGLSDAEEQSPAADGFLTDPLAADTDGDGVDDKMDNCPTVPNPGQEDATPATRRGDACEIGGPHIDQLQPNEGKVGDLVSIIGRNFIDGPLRFVRFGEGPPVAPISVTPTMILASVPAGSESGTVTIYLANGSTTAPELFTFRPAPEVVDFEPRIARQHSVVAVVGRYFIADGLQAFVGNLQAEILRDAQNVPIIEDYFHERELMKLIRIRVPDTAMMNGAIRVSTADGLGDSPMPLIIAGGPTIIDVQPNPAENNTTVLINGAGFSTADTGGGSVFVEFAGAGTTTVAFVTDTSIRVRVPANAVTGFVHVIHPAGTPRSPAVLAISGAASYVDLIQPSLAPGGETIALRGAGLSGASEVRFGAISATPQGTPTDTRIDVIVPADARGGALEVVLPSGSIFTSVPFRKLEESGEAANQSPGVGMGHSSDGSRLYVVRVGATMDGVVLDAETLAPITTTTLQMPSAPSGFAVAPNGSWGAISSTSEDRTYIVTLPDFTPFFTCEAKPPNQGDVNNAAPSTAFRFDLASERAYVSDPSGVGDSEDGILVIDHAMRSCETIARAPEATPGTSDFRGILSLSSSDLLIADAALGVGVLSVDRSLLYGSFIAPFHGPGVSQARLFWGPGNAYVLAAGPGLWRIDPTGSIAPGLINSSVILHVEQSSDRRWLTSGGRFFDVEGTAFPRPTLDFEDGPVAWHPTRNAVIVRGRNSQFLVHMEIVEN